MLVSVSVGHENSRAWLSSQPRALDGACHGWGPAGLFAEGRMTSRTPTAPGQTPCVARGVPLVSPCLRGQSRPHAGSPGRSPMPREAPSPATEWDSTQFGVGPSSFYGWVQRCPAEPSGMREMFCIVGSPPRQPPGTCGSLATETWPERQKSGTLRLFPLHLSGNGTWDMGQRGSGSQTRRRSEPGRRNGEHTSSPPSSPLLATATFTKTSHWLLSCWELWGGMWC